MICRMFALRHTFGPIKLLAYLVEALDFRANQGGAYSHILSPLVASALGFPGYVEGSAHVFD